MTKLLKTLFFFLLAANGIAQDTSSNDQMIMKGKRIYFREEKLSWKEAKFQLNTKPESKFHVRKRDQNIFLGYASMVLCFTFLILDNNHDRLNIYHKDIGYKVATISFNLTTLYLVLRSSRNIRNAVNAYNNNQSVSKY
jgi:hypothetical protein